MTKERAKNWHVFVAEMLVQMTKFAKWAEYTGGYCVLQSGNDFEIVLDSTIGKMDFIRPFGKMSASTVYDWSTRLPISSLVRMIDEMRSDILTK